MRTKSCIICGKEIKGSWETRLDWARRKYCSSKCRIGTKRSESEKQRISETCKKKGVGKWKIGTKRSPELRRHHSECIKRIVASGKHNFWKGGIAKKNRSFKANFQNTIEYRLWRTAVFARDNYTCIWCGARNGNGKTIELNADHIQSFAEYPELRLAIDNGRTLCRDCHYKRHSNFNK